MKSKFYTPAKKEGVVYHCIPVKPEGDHIRPSANYGMTISPEARAQIGMPPEEHTPLVFAATHITKSMAFGLQGTLGEKILNSSIEGSDGELVLACDREKLMSRVRDITIYEIPNKDFVTLEYADRQGVSMKPVPFDQAKIVFRGTGAEDLMRGGLQVLAFNKSFQEVHEEKLFESKMQDKQYKNLYEVIGALVKEGKVIWENKERGINPNPILAEKMGISLKAPEIIRKQDRGTKAPRP
jgi:hypothetical protein